MITSILEALYSFFDFTSLYKLGLITSDDAFKTWSFMVLAIACTWRLMQEAVLISTNDAKFGAAVRDCFIASILTTGYSVFWIVFSDFYSSIAGALNVDNLVYELLSGFKEKLDRKGTFKEDRSFYDYLNGTYLLGKIAWGFWYISAIMLITVDIFLRVIHALLYTICAVAGTIIIPLAVLKSKDVLWNWVRVSTIVLLWPITLGILLKVLMESVSFGSGVSPTELENTNQKKTSEGSVLVFQTILNIIVIALQVSAIRITQGFVTASASVAESVSPFAAAGVGTGVVLGSQMKDHILRRFNSSKGGKSKKKTQSGSRNKNKPAKIPQKKDKVSARK